MKIKQQIEQLFHQEVFLEKLNYQGCTSIVYDVIGLQQNLIFLMELVKNELASYHNDIEDEMAHN